MTDKTHTPHCAALILFTTAQPTCSVSQRTVAGALLCFPQSRAEWIEGDLQPDGYLTHHKPTHEVFLSSIVGGFILVVTLKPDSGGIFGPQR